LGLSDRVPDARTIWLFREKLSTPTGAAVWTKIDVELMIWVKC
jgi:hypothetical protein